MSRPATVRIYSPYFPYPVTEGAFQVVFDQVRALAAAGRSVELVCWKDAPAEIAARLAGAGPTAFPETVRITSLHGGFPRSGNACHWREEHASVGPDSEKSEPELIRLWRAARSLVSPLASPEEYYYPSEADCRAALPPTDLGIYHYSFAYAWLHGGAPAPEERVVVHFHNLESELSLLRASGPAGLFHRVNAAKLRAHEAALASHADELWFVSARDLARHRRRCAGAPARLVPPTFDLAGCGRRAARFARDTAGAPGSTYLGFIGGCHFEPNRASLEWIVRELAPELARRSFSGRILVVGRGVPERLRELAASYGFFDWLGFVPDLEGFWGELSFLLTPEVGGSGIRIKLLEALASGVPVIANHAALEALPADLAGHPRVFSREAAREWADLILAEQAPGATRRRLAGHDLEGTSLDASSTYGFLAGLLDGCAAATGG